MSAPNTSRSTRCLAFTRDDDGVLVRPQSAHLRARVCRRAVGGRVADRRDARSHREHAVIEKTRSSIPLTAPWYSRRGAFAELTREADRGDQLGGQIPIPDGPSIVYRCT